MEESAETAVLLGWLLRGTAKWCRSRRFACILFAVVHLLFELLGLLFVDKAQASKAIFQLKGVEKGSVLVITPCVEEFLVPNDSAR